MTGLKDIGADPKELPVIKAGTIWGTKEITIVLDYTPKNKINAYESILIQICDWNN